MAALYVSKHDTTKRISLLRWEVEKYKAMDVTCDWEVHEARSHVGTSSK